MFKDNHVIKNKKIIITGGAGFIGSHLCERLVKHNKIICVVVQSSTLYDIIILLINY